MNALVRPAAMTRSKDEYAIGDVSRRYHITFRTLRFYEDKNLLNPRRLGKSRFYSDLDLAQLDLILKCKELGFTLVEIQQLIRSQPGSDVCWEELLKSQTTLALHEKLDLLQRKQEAICSVIDILRRAQSARQAM